eukprot:3210286-Ditylum_brightwellii.AAC.1
MAPHVMHSKKVSDGGGFCELVFKNLLRSIETFCTEDDKDDPVEKADADGDAEVNIVTKDDADADGSGYALNMFRNA